jgi:hypothetical protein
VSRETTFAPHIAPAYLGWAITAASLACHGSAALVAGAFAQRIAFPGLAPVCAPSVMTATPFTNTCGTPTA